MSPADIIAALYAEKGLDFEHFLRLHLRHGFVFSTPRFFAMGRAVFKDGLPEDIRNPAYVFEHNANCWWIHAMAGEVSRAWDIMPWPLGWIGFERFDSACRFFRTETLRRLTLPIDALIESPLAESH